MVSGIKQLLGWKLLAIAVLLSGLLAGLAYATTKLSKTADEPEFPIVNTWQELIEEYLAFRDSSYPLIPPDGVLSDLPSLDGVAVETLQADPDWYWTFEQNIYLFDETGELANQILHNTEIVIYEDMAANELLVHSAPETEGEDYKEEIVFRALPWPEPGVLERSSRYLYRELTKRRMVWKVTLKSRKETEKEALAASRMSASRLALDESGLGMMRMMYTGTVEEVTIVSMKKTTNGLLLEIGYPTEYTGTSWSVYSYDAPACVYTNASSAGGGTPTPPGDDETNICEDCFSCTTDPEKSFLGLERVWTPAITNLVLTGDTRTVWTDTRPLGLDSSNEPCHRFYGLGNNEVDADSDGLSDAVERFVHKTEPSNVDTDDDRIPDGWEVSRGLNPLDQGDGLKDADQDGFVEVYEYRHNTDPLAFTSRPSPTISVTNGGIVTIQQAINWATNDYDIVQVGPGIYSGPGNSRLAITNNILMLYSDAGAGRTVIDSGGDGIGVAMNANPDVVLQGLDICNGYSGVWMSSNNILRNCRVYNNGRETGGGIRCKKGTLIEGCDIFSNRVNSLTGGGGGGGIYAEEDCVVLRSVIRLNVATDYGGGMACFGNTRIEDCAIFGNVVGNYTGGGIRHSQGTLTIRNCTIYSNLVLSSEGGVGGLYSDNNLGGEIANTIIWGNRGGQIDGLGANDTIRYCCIQAGVDGVGIITNNPGIAADGIHIEDDQSPCRDAGWTTAERGLDIDGEPRPWQEYADIGCDEWVDTDGDTILDYTEIQIYGTNPNEADSDGDGLRDDYELFSEGTNPDAVDTDDDGLTDGPSGAVSLTSHPQGVDIDGDGFVDGEIEMGSSPLLGDTDGDGMQDGYDPYATSANCFIEKAVTIALPSIPETDFADGTGNPEYYDTLEIDPALPVNAASVKTVRVYGYVDDAIAINGNHAVWELARWTTEPFDVDATQWITDRRRGTFELDVYDYIFEGWISNHVFFSGAADITYLEALSYDLTIEGESNMCVGGSVQWTVNGGVSPYTWLSDNAAVATVDNQGLVSGVSPGVTTITAVDSNGCQKAKEVVVLKVEITPASMNATESLDSGTFTCTVTPLGLNPTYEWLTGAANGAWPAIAGNNPELDYNASSASATIVKQTRWFAPTPSRRQAVDGVTCSYSVNCEVTVGGVKCRASTPATLSVEVDMTGQTYGPEFQNWNSITVAQSGGIWRVTGQGNFSRSAPNASVNMPTTSQFYAKAMVHEDKHVAQWMSESPWKDLIDANALYNSTLSVLTSNVSEADLRAKIYAAVQAQDVADTAVFNANVCAMEAGAFAAMNVVDPDFLELDDADWQPLYGCP